MKKLKENIEMVTLTGIKTVAILIGLFLLSNAPTLAQFEATREIVAKNKQIEVPGRIISVTAQAGVTTKQQVGPTLSNVLKVFNSAPTPADIDFTAFDSTGAEIERETVPVEAGSERMIGLYEVFPNLLFTELSSIKIQTSVQSELEMSEAAQNALASQNAVMFFSQIDPQWKSIKLGTCKSDTIGSAGCAITSIAMAMARKVSNLNPATLNKWLTNNKGYSNGCLVNWAAPANIDGPGGFQYLGSSTVGSATNLKRHIDSGNFLVVKSSRFTNHYSVIIGYRNNGSVLSDFYFLDPQDSTARFRYIGDTTWVKSTSPVQIYN